MTRTVTVGDVKISIVITAGELREWLKVPQAAALKSFTGLVDGGIMFDFTAPVVEKDGRKLEDMTVAQPAVKTHDHPLLYVVEGIK